MLVSCAAPRGAEDTATQFWRALIAGQADTVRKLVRDSDRELLDGGRTVLPVDSFTLGRTRHDGARTEIATQLHVAGDTPMTLDVTTVVVRVGDEWRVDYASSVRDIARDSELAKMLEQLRQLAARAGSGLDRSLEELQQALPKLEDELSNIEKDIRSQVPELRKRMEELGKQLRPKPPEAAPPPDYRKAI